MLLAYGSRTKLCSRVQGCSARVRLPQLGDSDAKWVSYPRQRSLHVLTVQILGRTG